MNHLSLKNARRSEREQHSVALSITPFLTAGLLDSFAELTVKCRAHPLVQ